MEYRPLAINVIGAKDLMVVNLITKMDVYVVVSSSTDPRSNQRTPTDKHGHTNPRWNYTLSFTLPEPALQSNSQTLVFSLYSNRALGDKLIGQADVPLKQLLDVDAQNVNSWSKIVTYDVRTRSGKIEGSLDFSYKFGEKYLVPIAVEEPVTAYPAAAGPGTAGHHFPPPPYGAMPYPAQWYNGHPNNLQPGYGHPSNLQPGYVHPSNLQPGYAHPSNLQPGYGHPNNLHPGYGYPNNLHPGYGYPNNLQPGYGYPNNPHPGYGYPN